jgi:hypothetical protein
VIHNFLKASKDDVDKSELFLVQYKNDILAVFKT